MLTVEQINKLMCDELSGQPQTVKGDEADAFLKELREEVKAAKKKGLVLETLRE